MLIDYKSISEQALRGVAEQFVISLLSEADESPSLDNWVQEVLSKVKRGELVLEYSELDESVSLKPKNDVVLMP